MPHCSSLWLPYPTDLCFLRIPLCPPHQAAHIPMSRHFFHFSVFRPCLQPSRSFLLWYKKNQNNRSGRPISGFHCFDNTCTLRYKFGNQVCNYEINIRLTFYRSRKGEKNESQKLGVSRPGSYYLRRLFSPFVRQKRIKVRTGDVRG